MRTPPCGAVKLQFDLRVAVERLPMADETRAASERETRHACGDETTFICQAMNWVPADVFFLCCYAKVL
jgi:hypothetical protein